MTFFFFFFFFKQKTAYEIMPSLVGSEMCIRDSSYAKDFAVRNGIQYVERQPEVIASGSCGTNVSWELYSDGILNIKGTGTLTNPTVSSGIAWYTYRHMIRLVNIEAGITNLPDFAFFGCTALELSLIHISEPTRLGMISYAVFCLKKKKKKNKA